MSIRPCVNMEFIRCEDKSFAAGVERAAQIDHFTALVRPAMRAYAVRQLLLVAVGALGDTGLLQGVVGAALGGPGLGMTSFRIGHCNLCSVGRIPPRLSRSHPPRAGTPVYYFTDLQISKGLPTVVHRFCFAVAGIFVPISPAHRAYTGTLLTAYPLHRQG